MSDFNDLNHYHAYKSSGGDSENGGSGGGGGGGFGCGWIVIVVVGWMLIHFIFNGASAVAIDRLLGFGLIAFFFARLLYN